MSSHKGSRLGPRVSARQREILVEFMERHPYLVKPSCALNPELTAARKEELWKELVSLLNNEGPAVKTVHQWRAFWNKETHDARHDAAVHAAEHRGTGGGKLPGLRGRILSLVGVASAIGVCPNFFEDAEEVSEEPRAAESRPSGSVSVGEQPGTSGIQARLQQQPQQPVKRPAPSEGEDGGSRKRPRQGVPSRSRSPRMDEVVADLSASYGHSVDLYDQNLTVLQDLATGVRALTDAIAQQAADIAQVGDTLLRQTLAQERLATAAERQVQQNDMMLQELRTLTRMAPALLVLLHQSLGNAASSERNAP
ncbi:uncharacterized protein LOC125942947 [Dermacentor silvarum]|uniref:uncharacterized protein LOC125942947 n=1 Tax=Dermacentor silvarum TaxID=543639 RepID=UPI0021015F34|nr:uncharacterized protein LOC125942947 [Dermacentor silvarum]